MLSQNTDLTEIILQKIAGSKLEHNLKLLAQVGGKILESGYTSVTRLALSQEDYQARQKILLPWMQNAGMTVEEHPLGLIGMYAGENSDLSPIIVFSHFDSVPESGMYDGDVGTVAAIEIINLLYQIKIRLKRTVIVVAFSGEEASRFNIAHIGSISMFRGLNENDLNTKKAGDLSVREILNEEKQIAIVKKQIFGTKYPKPCAAVELHIDQTGQLEKLDKEIGVVTAIAGFSRFNISIGDEPLAVDEQTHAMNCHFKITVHGKSGHSGGTPMGKDHRADGLVVMAQILEHLYTLQEKQNVDTAISIGQVFIQSEAINKIPGTVETTIKISANHPSSVDQRASEISRYIGSLNSKIAMVLPQFDPDPIAFEKIEDHDHFYEPKCMTARHASASALIQYVHDVCNTHQNTVGTVGTYKIEGGKIILGLDVRGIDRVARDQAVNEIKNKVIQFTQRVSSK